MLKNTLILSLGLSLLSGSAWSDNAATYEALFKGSILNNASVNGDADKAQAYADCHMMAMGTYPEAIQQATYDAAESSGDYQQARTAFSQVLAIEMAAGENRKAAIMLIIEQSQTTGEACLDSLK